ATGGRAYGYRDGKVDKGEAYIVREIFGRFADGASCRTIAADLNARRILSPGTTWKRTERRAAGWMGSGIRVIVRNERYRGVVHWNASEWRKDPDTGKRKRIARIVKEMQDHYVERVRATQERAVEAPRELQELAARIERLRERLQHGDPDMTADELQAAIDRRRRSAA